MAPPTDVIGLDPSKSDLAKLLSYRLSVVSSLLSRSLVLRFGESGTLTLPEWRVLVLVNNYGPLPVKALARHAGLDFGQTSRIASGMCETELMVKERTEDARSVNLSLTPAGKALHRKLWKLAMQTNSDVLAVLEEDEREGLFKALDKLAASAKGTIERSQKRAAVSARRA